MSQYHTALELHQLRQRRPFCRNVLLIFECRYSTLKNFTIVVAHASYSILFSTNQEWLNEGVKKWPTKYHFWKASRTNSLGSSTTDIQWKNKSRKTTFYGGLSVPITNQGFSGTEYTGIFRQTLRKLWKKTVLPCYKHFLNNNHHQNDWQQRYIHGS